MEKITDIIKEVETKAEIAVLGVLIKVENTIEKMEQNNPEVCDFVLNHQVTASQLTTP